MLERRRGKARSGCVLGTPNKGPLVGSGTVGLGRAIDSGRDFWVNEGGREGERLRILENSRVYHSESDSSSDEWPSDREEKAV
jgi:hypothetical protein